MAPGWAGYVPGLAPLRPAAASKKNLNGVFFCGRHLSGLPLPLGCGLPGGLHASLAALPCWSFVALVLVIPQQGRARWLFSWFCYHHAFRLPRLTAEAVKSGEKTSAARGLDVGLGGLVRGPPAGERQTRLVLARVFFFVSYYFMSTRSSAFPLFVYPFTSTPTQMDDRKAFANDDCGKILRVDEKRFFIIFFFFFFFIRLCFARSFLILPTICSRCGEEP